MRIFHEEQFGPVVPVVPFDDVDEPIAHIVASNYGLQASLFGRDAEAVGGLIDVLANQVGRINVNAQCQRGPDTFPYTGRKDSAECVIETSLASGGSSRQLRTFPEQVGATLHVASNG